MSTSEDDTIINIVDSPPMTAIPIDNYIMKRIPSLNKVSSWSTEETDRDNRVPLMYSLEEKQEKHSYLHYTCLEKIHFYFHKYEKKIVHNSIKLLFHILLISVFETLFFFMYVSLLEDGGIEHTMNSFIDGASQQCQNMTTSEIKIINSYLGPYINRTEIELEGNRDQLGRSDWNYHIMIQSWIYVTGLSGFFIMLVLYSCVRRIEVEWDIISLENLIMIGLLSAYEIIFFNKIIFHYQPISSGEIRRNAIEEIHDSCGLF